jgi:MFS family permease
MRPRPGAGIAAALVLNPALGSLYTWSVFIAPLETALAAPRADISAVFAVAIASFTAGMVAAPYLYRFAAAPLHLLGCAVLAVVGLTLSAGAGAVWQLLLGYGVLFGLGGGYAYSITLQLIVLALPERRGLATGLGIGSFALGSILLAVVFAETVSRFGPFQSFAVVAAVMGLAGLLAALLAWRSRLTLPDARLAQGGETSASFARIFPWLWLGFLFGAFAGVMSIGHAAGIVADGGGTLGLAVVGTVVINIGNAGGRIAAGIVSDYVSPTRVAALAHLAAGIGFVLIIFVSGPTAAVVALGFEGLAYGLASGAYPAAVAIYFGVARYGRYLGFLITAWGVAGLSGPWLAGWLYDYFGTYVPAAAIGLALAAAGLVVSLRIPRPS